MISEIYMRDRDYAFTVAHLLHILRQEQSSPDQRYAAVHAALRGAGLDLGSTRVVGSRIVPERYSGLCEALAGITADRWTGVLDADAVKLALGQEGDVWPAWTANLTLDTLR